MPIAIEKDRRYTYGEIEKFPADQSWELIDGIPYMQARPSLPHQICLGRLHLKFGNYLEVKKCLVLLESAVWLDLKPAEKEKSSSNYVVPDLLVVCEQDKIQDKGIHGVPDLIVEILSPGTAGVDIIQKYNKYLKSGVREYWIVDPLNQVIRVCILEHEQYQEKFYDREGKIPVNIFNGDLEIKLAEVFPPLEEEED